jgi:PAS domain S-box-containing protein
VLPTERPTFERYAVAVLSVAVALALRILLDAWLAPSVFLIFVGAIMVSAWYGGTGPGLVATALSSAAAAGFFLPESRLYMITDVNGLAQLVIFSFEGILISLLSGRMRRAHARALASQRATEQARSEAAEAHEKFRKGAAVESELRARLAAVVESSDDAIISVDPAGAIRSWNAGATRLFGWSADEAVGRPISVILPPERGTEAAFLERVLAGEPVGPVETTRMGRDGRRLDVSLGASPLRDDEGRVVGGAAILRDMSRQRRDEAEIHRLNRDLERRVAVRTAELEAANKELEAFSYSVSHDLRAPLRALEGFSRILIEDHGTQLDAEMRRYLEMIRENTERMAALINDLLRLSRLSRQPLEWGPVNPNVLVAEALEELKPEYEGRRIEFTIGALPPCQGDRGLLRQVFVNLLSNAIKYSRRRDPAHIEVGGSMDGEEPRYFVRDDGVGFDMRYASDKLFGVFQRFHRADEYEGTGVGLAIARRIVLRHGGHIRGDAAPDRGATFTFSIRPAPSAVEE